MSAFAITTECLSKRYGDVLAVDRVDLHVAPAEIYGFLGRNGAGKSTTIRMLLGMVAPTGGRAWVLGQPVHGGATEVWRRVGHLVETATAWPELTVRENLDVSRRLHGLRDPGVVARMIEQLRLGPYADRRARALSLGNLQRLALARALLHRPALLLLDEPANGLDPAGVLEIRELLRSLARDHGVTLFMSSHHLAEVDRLATRVGIVHEGRLIEELDASELEARRQQRLVVGARDLDAADRALRAAGLTPARAGQSDGSVVLELAERRALDAPEDIARLLVAADVPPTRLGIVREDLEGHFVRLTGGAP